MSASESATPSPSAHPNLPLHESARTHTHDILPDPLLDSGSFIHPADETLIGSQIDGAERDKNRKMAKPLETRRYSSTTEAAEGAVSGTDNSGRKMSVEKPNWLPPGWIVEDKVRTSGATAGTIDKYYVEPGSGRKFRSRKEVLYFLENGTPRKRKKFSENSDATTAPDAKTVDLNFDFHDVPDKVEWVLTNSSEGSWTPSIGEDKISDSTKHEWLAAFSVATTRNGL